MTCPHPPGTARLFLGRWAARLGVATLMGLGVLTTPSAQAAPTTAKTPAPPASAASASKATKTTKARKPVVTKSTSKSASKSASQSTKSSKSTKKPAKTASTTRSKRHGKAAPATAAAAATTATTAATAGTVADERNDAPETGVRLPLMLRVTPSLPDTLDALRTRLSSVVSAQGASAQGASVGDVSRLGPEIYAFSLRCADAEQCQHLRLVIESERDWVAGLQLDERRRIPRTPERGSPAAR